MKQILRLIPAYREMEKQLAELALQKSRLEDNERWYQARIDALDKQVRELQKDALRGAQTVADFIAQYTLGRRIYGVGPELPQQQGAPEPIPGPQLARRIEEEAMSPERIGAMIEQYEKDLGIATGKEDGQ